VSFDLGNNVVNRTTDNLTHLPVERGEFGAPCPLASEWITLSVLDANRNIKNMPVEVHLRGRTITNHRKDFCIIFDLSEEWDGNAFGSGRKISSEAHIPLNGTSQSQMEQFVLVGVGEISQDAQERREGWMRTIVRLRQLDSCPNWIANRSKVMPLIDGSIEPILAIGNRELQLPLERRGVGGSFVSSNCKNEMVESIPKVIESICDQERPSLQGGNLIHSDKDAMSSAIKVFLFEQTIRVSVRPSQEFILEGLSVFLAPR